MPPSNSFASAAGRQNDRFLAHRRPFLHGLGLEPTVIEHLAEQLDERKRREKEAKKAEIRDKEVKQIWAALDSGTFHATQRDRVAFLLKNYPDTRDSDMTLTLRYWREFQPDVYTEDAIKPHLLFKLERLTTIARLRAKIQNEYGLFLGSEEVQHKRRQKEAEVKESMLADKSPPSVIQIFADETGKNGDYLIVGSVWFLNISRVTSLQAAVGELFANKKMQAKEFHFKECGSGNLDLYKLFVDLAVERLEYVVFKAIITRRKGIQRSVEQAIMSMLRQLMIQGYEQELTSRRVIAPRTLDLIMDEGGLDPIGRAELPETTSRLLQEKHGAGNVVGRVSEANSKGSAAIQLADIFCGALNRRMNETGPTRKPKDELSDYVFDKLQPRVAEMNADETLKLIELK